VPEASAPWGERWEQVNRITLVAVVTSPHGRPLAKGSAPVEMGWVGWVVDISTVRSGGS